MSMTTHHPSKQQHKAAPRLKLQRKTCSCGRPIVANGKCAACSKKRAKLQRRAVTSQNGPQNAPPIVHEVLRESGRPLPPATRAFMEPRLGHTLSNHSTSRVSPTVAKTGLQIGEANDPFEREAEKTPNAIMHFPTPQASHHDLSHVRIHTGIKATQSANAVSARAYTVGRNIVFGAGQYQPETLSGQRLLAHELTHVAQQESSGDYRVSRIPKEDQIPDRYNFTANCGWIDWSHAQPSLAQNLINRVQSTSDALRAAGRGASATTGRLDTPNMQSAAGGIVLSRASLSINLLRPLSNQEVLSVALSIFKRLSIVFETLQEWTDFVGHSSFSQEDLPSNLIGFYRAAMNYSRSDVENFCGLVTPSNPIRRHVTNRRYSAVLNITNSLQEYQRDHDFERNYTFSPVDAVGPWPSQLSSISTTNAENLYEIRTIQARRGPHNIHRLCPIYRVVGRIGQTDLFILSIGGHRFTAADNLRVKPTYRFHPTTHGQFGHTTMIEVEPYGTSDAAQFRRHGISSPIEIPVNNLVCLSSHSNPV